MEGSAPYLIYLQNPERLNDGLEVDSRRIGKEVSEAAGVPVGGAVAVLDVRRDGDSMLIG
jgi:hypothetical protein